MSKSKQKALSDKISKIMHEGVPDKQAVALEKKKKK